MTFQDLLKDIEKLEGLQLSSIRPGAELYVEEVDLSQDKIIVRTKQGKLNSRSIAEFRRIWDALLSAPAVHVDEVLHGSGSSRNQPETILANLPYIEWLKVTNKKHIAFVGAPTHSYGTLKQMNPLQAAAINTRMQSSEVKVIKAVISSRELSDEVRKYEWLSGKTAEALNEKTYGFDDGSGYIFFIDSDYYDLPAGTYSVFQTKAKIEFVKRITLYGRMLGLFEQGPIKGLFELPR